MSGGLSFYIGFNSLLSAPPFVIFNIKLVSMIVMLCLCYVCWWWWWWWYRHILSYLIFIAMGECIKNWFYAATVAGNMPIERTVEDYKGVLCVFLIEIVLICSLVYYYHSVRRTNAERKQTRPRTVLRLKLAWFVAVDIIDQTHASLLTNQFLLSWPVVNYHNYSLMFFFLSVDSAIKRPTIVRFCYI